MNKNYLTFAYAISGISIIIGLLMIFNSGSRGQSLASAEINRNDGMMDTAQYNMSYEAGINQFLILGGILMGFGLLMTCVLSFVLLLRSKPEAEEELHV
ncbi:hypothetical protein [Planomicrobium okeanokoites]|uniref:Uncharacterized protein n=1 Tax=Planomicrobium okeanokoites TaxID=244 RepID=A0ABV7KSY0_PLAOK|nr:hypothetical protein [Planomicrobium okeanokoites]TAA70320.1 hypothetical protein D2910_07715 [Planomicrobium okeanokoites]